MPQARKALLLPLLLGAAVAHAGVCESGRRQSPIDITSAVPAKLPALQFAYRPAPLKLADDGHTMRVRFDGGSELRIGPQRYRLQQFHFHTPGGDRIAGEEFPMATHLLHKSASGQLLAVVVFFRVGAENPLLASLLPLIPPRADGDHLHPQVMVSAGGLLPTRLAYYRYPGSLTAPPCTEGVDWIVLKQPIELSAAQLAAYRKRFADNARAVQPTNSRIVLESP
jgi:carbonic anhydrase